MILAAPRARTAAVVVFLLASTAALAGQPWDVAFQASPSELRTAATALPPPSGADVEVLLDEVCYTFDAQHRVTSTRRLVYRLLTAQGARKWATTESGWHPWHEERPEFRARVISANGDEHLLDPSTVAEQAEATESPDTFSDGRHLRGPLPAMEAGALVEEQITVREKVPYFSKGSVYRHFFGKEVPVRRGLLILEAPAELALRFEVKNTTPKISDTKTRGVRTVTFEVNDLPVEEPVEPFAPHDAQSWRYVAFSTARSWTEVATEYSKLVGGQLDEDVKGIAAAAFPAGKLTRDQTIRAALAWLRKEIRYTGIEFGEAALVPRGPAEVLTRKYGDCKDLATLLKALLRTRGIDAEVALLRTSWDEVPEKLPGLGLFDHAIVYVPGAPALWIDPTSPVTPLGELPLGDQGRLALVASPKTTVLARIPEAPLGTNRSLVTRELRLSENGPARLLETRTASGSIAGGYREPGMDHDAASVRVWYQGFVKEAFGASDLADFQYGAWDAVDQPFQLSLAVDDATIATTADEQVTVNLSIAGILGWLPDALTANDDEDKAKRSPRKADFLLLEPYTAELRFKLVPPPGYAARPLPVESDSRKLGPASLTRSFVVDKDGAVNATYKFDTGKRRYSAQEFEEFRSAFAAWSEESQDQVGFEHEGKTLLGAGKVREALDVYRGLVALHPKEALHEVHLARALLEAGFGEDARAHARRAVTLEPNSAQAHQLLGWVLQHDGLGRRFHRGFDLEGSIAEYRQAKALGGAFEARGDLAILLEHDANGTRYGKGAHLDQAIAEYRALRKELDRHELDENLLFALLWSGRLAELKAEALTVKESPTRNSLRVVAVAALEGAPAALAEAGRLDRASEARRKVISSAADQLVQLRQYGVAAALLTEASRGSREAAQLQPRIALLGKMKRHEELKLDGKDPKSAVVRATAKMFDPTLAPAELGKLFAKQVIAKAKPEELGRSLLEAVAPHRKRLAGNGISAEVAVDSALSAMEMTVDGDEGGYRVRVSVPLTKSRQEAWFLLKEDGEFKILSTSRSPEALGGEALRLAKKGQLPLARRWLNWAREGVACGGDPDRWGTFCAVWPENGKSEDRQEVIDAAAAVAVLADDPAEATALLEARRRTAPPELARKIDWTLALAHLAGGRFEPMNAVADRIVAAEAHNPRAVALKLAALSGLKKGAEAEALAEKRLADDPEDPVALSELMVLLMRRGEYAAGIARGERLIALGRASPNTYNELAWAALFHGGIDERALEYAQRASVMTDNGNRAYLHTLASLDAEAGKNVEARQVLLSSVELRLEDEPEPADWYVIGRIAENYALFDTARAAYQKSLVSKDPASPGSVELLAKRRLDALPSTAIAGPTPP